MQLAPCESGFQMLNLTLKDPTSQIKRFTTARILHTKWISLILPDGKFRMNMDERGLEKTGPLPRDIMTWTWTVANDAGPPVAERRVRRPRGRTHLLGFCNASF